MARYLMLWRGNPATMPARLGMKPSEIREMHEKFFAAIDNLIKKGEIEDFGFFPESREGGAVGYAIIKTTDIVRTVWAFPFSPHILCEVHEIISFERGKEITMELFKAMEAAEK